MKENVVIVNCAVPKEAYHVLSMMRHKPDNEGFKISHGALVKKDAGKLCLEDGFVSEDEEGRGWTGGLIGGLVGLLAGPVGALIAGGVGALIGTSMDRKALKGPTRLLEKASERLADGVTAVLLLAQEQEETALEQRLKELKDFQLSITRMDATELAAEIESAKKQDRKADRILYGNIYTVDKNQPRAAAVAIADGKFVYVGDETGAKAFLGEGTEELRYEEGIILPGLGEGHGHIAPGGTEALFTVHLNPFGTLKEHLAAIKEFAEKHPELEVIQGAGFIPTPDMGPNGPTADLLDGLTDKPVVLADIGHHSYWVNHAAMERLGIDKNTPDVSDGIITRDDAGNPTGYFREGAMDLLKPLTVFTVEQYKEGYLYYQEEYLAHGETLILDPIINWDSTDNAAEACHQLDMEGKLKMHVYAAYQVFQAKGHDTMAEIAHAAELRERTRGPMFELSNIKIQLDGTMPGNPSTAYMKEPYTDPWSQEHQHHGQLRLDMETLIAVFKRSHELGFTVHVHAIGDGALAMALDAIEKVQAECGPHDYRDAVTHLQVVDKEDIPRMAKLGVVASTDPHWFDMDPDYFGMIAAVLGEERAENQLPMKSFFDAGVVVTSASDYPVTNPAYPLTGMQKGVIRQLPGRPDTLHNAGERVTIEQMIQATTINEAYQLLCDDRLGSITAGKEADLVVLGEDITACDPEHIQDAPVLATMVGGAWVYTRA